MEQYLIDKLWNHTNKADEENARKAKDLAWQEYLGDPVILPGAAYFPDANQALFMSFHNEASNDFRHFHDFFELLYVCSGTPVGVINGQEIPLSQGNLCIMNPNAVHYFKKYAQESDLILNIVLPKDVFQKSLFRILFSDPVLNAFFIRYRLENEKQTSFLYLQHLDQDVDHLIEIMIKEYLDKRQYSQVIIESLLTLLFSFILRIYTENTRQANLAIAEITDYIYMNYQTVSMESAAAHFNYHPKYLSALIHRHTGQTFRSMMVNIKLQNALNYLLYTDNSVEQIVSIIGYKDKSSFYSQFKKEYGMSPAGYRKQFS